MISVAVLPSAPVTTGVLHGTTQVARLVAIENASYTNPVDVALVDGYGAARTSIDVAAELARSGRARAVVLHALHITPDLISAARQAQLAGVVGRQVFGPALVDTLIDIASEPEAGQPVVFKSADHALSTQEREILILIGEGHSNDGIGRELDVSVNTVKSSARALYRKLGVKNRTGAALMAHHYARVSMSHPVVPAGE